MVQSEVFIKKEYRHISHTVKFRGKTGSATFHSQDRERIALVIDAVTAECAEAHPLVEFHGGWVLLVDIDILHILLIERLLNQHSPYALPEIVRMEEQHLYLAFLHAHKTDGAPGILHPP